MELSNKTLIITIIITLLSTGAYVVNDQIIGGEQLSIEEIQSMIDDGDWYYCELENSLKQCGSLSRYSVDDARCNFLEGGSDICTKSGVRMAWNPFSNYIGVKLSDPFVESIQLKKVNFYNVSEDVYINCTKWNYNLSDCIEFVFNESIQSDYCVDWSKVYYDSICYNGTKKVLKNVTTFEGVGFNINYSDKTYTVIGACCEFYSVSPYKEFVDLPVISCKEIVGGVCNPLIQQSSNVFSVYDEYGRIYVIHKTYVEPRRVGSYDYVNNYAIEPSKLIVKEISVEVLSK